MKTTKRRRSVSSQPFYFTIKKTDSVGEEWKFCSGSKLGKRLALANWPTKIPSRSSLGFIRFWLWFVIEISAIRHGPIAHNTKANTNSEREREREREIKGNDLERQGPNDTAPPASTEQPCYPPLRQRRRRRPCRWWSGQRLRARRGSPRASFVFSLRSILRRPWFVSLSFFFFLNFRLFFTVKLIVQISVYLLGLASSLLNDYLRSWSSYLWRGSKP